MDYRHCCVIDSNNHYKTIVLVHQEPDEGGQLQDVIQYYTLHGGESLIDTIPPTYRPHAGAVGLISPRWDGSTWAEAATAAEIAAWEAAHPAPEPPEPPFEEQQIEFNIDLDYRLSLVELGLV